MFIKTWPLNDCFQQYVCLNIFVLVHLCIYIYIHVLWQWPFLCMCLFACFVAVCLGLLCGSCGVELVCDLLCNRASRDFVYRLRVPKLELLASLLDFNAFESAQVLLLHFAGKLRLLPTVNSRVHKSLVQYVRSAAAAALAATGNSSLHAETSLFSFSVFSLSRLIVFF